MYYCTDCNKRFFDPKIVFERHGAVCPPYEKHVMCPYCESGNIVLLEVRHCRFCGAKLPYNAAGDYCDAACEKRGKRLWELEAKRRKERVLSPVYAAVRAVEEYNKTHGTHLSYGGYFGKKAGDQNGKG